RTLLFYPKSTRKGRFHVVSSAFFFETYVTASSFLFARIKTAGLICCICTVNKMRKSIFFRLKK
ncbi:hypothetical protein, partial [Enterococcus xiangfangensis]|uniref:hypothetical protein n=1 Tax=Enterococcus xiangfangensis TaxID=1296537 RepID=UPI00195E579D